jgi:hypothetical protein
MSCCGKARSRVAATLGGTVRPKALLFEYVGRTSLTITGTATRTSYRFPRPGARVVVDARDQPSLAAIPLLRIVSG